ncbi:MAG: hypothetical protein AAF688_07865 [Bacteroidota bacterium]
MKTTLLKVLFCVIAINLGAIAQNNKKLSTTINVDKDVMIDLNTNYVQLEIDTWNKNEVQVEAYIDDKKLSGEELKKALKNWELKVEGSGDYVKIYSRGSSNSWDGLGDLVFSLDTLNLGLESLGALAELEVLGDLNFEMPELPEMPEMPELASLALPELPELPDLPELPEGVNNVTFDTEKYEKEGEAYLERWSKEYEERYGKEYKEKMKAWAREMAKVDFKNYEVRMKEWGEKFGKDFGEDYAKKMEVWGVEFSERFDDEWAEKMEAWGERFGKKMEAQAKRMEKRSEALEKRAKTLQKRAEIEQNRAKARQKKVEKLAKRGNYKKSEIIYLDATDKSDKVKKTIKIKMPKKANLQMNVRHGALKFSSLIENIKADLTHASLIANHIGGSSTSINVAYSPVQVELWSQGELNLKYVGDAHIGNAKRLMLNSNSSNIILDKLSGNAIIDGSFGDLVISEITDDFSNLNVVLENSDAIITLPKTDYNVYFKGNRSKLNNKSISQKTIENANNGKISNRSIVLNTKFSDVILK